MEYQTELTQEEINILISRYLKSGKYIRKLKNDGKINNYTHQIKYFTAQTHKMIEETARKFFIAIFKNACENYRQEYKDKNFMDDIIDKFVNKIKILINDEDNEIPSDEKIEIVGMINEVLENRTYSKKAKEKFQQILENMCEDYGYDPIQEYCKICNRGDNDKSWEYNSC
ncbi:hypothetical protein C2G38_2318652 [Gigaspora rosea]|uniref:Uncharacterized protein n=1 Tax=Gigaspora rosea TaxID=44941 RepID=A0A397UZM4_9GLOM|nr:hypothetical protein C2G38_2318652 [Gigaspora rosea]